MTGSLAGLWEKNRKIVGVSLVLLASLLMMRCIVVISKMFFSEYPSFRIMMGLDLVFVLLIPFLLVFLPAGTMDSRTSFFLPLVIIGIVYPLCDALFLDPVLLLYPPFYFPFLIGGCGFGLIGLAGNTFHADVKRSLVFFTAGIAVILLNAASFIPIAYFVVTGDATVLQLVPGL